MCKIDTVYKMAISKFQHFDILTAKFRKTDTFKNLNKIQNFQKFEKTEYTYVIETNDYCLQPTFKEIHKYFVPKSSKKLKNYAYQKVQLHFFGRFRQLTKMKMVPLNSC